MGKRRASGEGLLRWRKDRKHWEGRIVIGTNEKGNPISKCFSGKTQKEVVEQMALYREQLQGQTLSPASRMKLRDWTEKWLNEYMVHLVRPETISNYRRECELHIYPFMICDTPLPPMRYPPGLTPKHYRASWVIPRRVSRSTDMAMLQLKCKRERPKQLDTSSTNLSERRWISGKRKKRTAITTQKRKMESKNSIRA